MPECVEAMVRLGVRTLMEAEAALPVPALVEVIAPVVLV